MSYKKILVPYDQSEHAKCALTEAIRIADANTTIKVIEVSAPPQNLVYSSMNQATFGVGAVIPPDNFAELVKQSEQDAKDKLDASVADVIKDAPCTVDVEVVYGIYTVETIIDTAKAEEADLIAMGCRGLGAIRGALGSVSYAVLRNAEVPVLVVK